MGPHHCWRVRKALYGLQTSPRDWAEHRDQALRGMKIQVPVPATFHQSVTDSSLWHIRDQGGSLVAIVIVYVDDVALFDSEPVLKSLVQVIGEKWTLSEPTWSTNQTTATFCGMELRQLPWGWRVTQVKYLTELLKR